jgi:hypothetical protein
MLVGSFSLDRYTRMSVSYIRWYNLYCEMLDEAYDRHSPS